MPLPANPVALYWVWWNPFQRLVNFPTTYNMFFLFHAYPADGEATGGNTGAVQLRKPGGTIGTFYNADIATCRARGQKILVSVGGAGGQVYITSQARADAFVASIKSMNEGLGGSGTTAAFDGIDWNNFEGVQQGSQGAWMTYAGQQLKAYYGNDFLFSSPPAAFGGGQDVSDRTLLATLYQGGVLDWLCPQYYDPFDLNTLAKLRYYSDFYHTAVTINGSSVQIPRDHIGVGFSLAPVASSSRWSPSGAASAYTTIVNEGYQPKGAFNWANHEDTGNSFATVVAPVITNNTDPVVDSPAFSLSLSSQFTDGANTTAQLTAPSGKTSGADFQAGEMGETSNPLPAIDLGSGKYTEVEWCIQATADAEDAAQYEFRVTYFNSTGLETYSVTPRWTIGTPAQEPDPDPEPPPQDTGAYLTFDGDGDYVQIPDAAAYSVPTTGTLTVSAWIRPDTLLFTETEDAGTEGTYVMYLGKGNYDVVNSLEWGFRMYSNDGTRPNRISFYIFNLVGGLGVGSFFQETVNTNEWILVTGVVTASQTKIYKNGVLKDSDTYTSGDVIITPENGTAPVRVGTMTTDGFFEGAIDDVCIWNRALSDSEILDIYNGTVTASGLVGRWKFDDGSGNTAVDSVSANNGTLVPGSGSPAWVVTTTEVDDPKTLTAVGSLTGVGSITL